MELDVIYNEDCLKGLKELGLNNLKRRLTNTIK